MGARMEQTEIGTVILMGRKIVEIFQEVEYSGPSSMVELI
jgi:hypothetical protein